MLVLGSCAWPLSEKESFTFVSCKKETHALPRLFKDFWLLRFTDEVKVSDTLLENALLLTVFRKVSENKRRTDKCEFLDFSSKLLWMRISCVKPFFGHFAQKSCAIDVVTCRQTLPMAYNYRVLELKMFDVKNTLGSSRGAFLCKRSHLLVS